MQHKLGWGGFEIETSEEANLLAANEGDAETKSDVPSTVEGDGQPKTEPEEPKRQMIFIDLFGTINRNTPKEIISKLRPDLEFKKSHRIFMSISSPGGSLLDSQFIDSVLKSWPHDTVMVAGSRNSSGATYLLAKAPLRLAYGNARFMMHDMWSCNDGSIREVEDRLEDAKAARAEYVESYIEHIGLTKKEIEKIMQRDTYFGAIEALNLGTKGLIDGIIIKMLGDFKVEIYMRGGIRKTVDLHDDSYIDVRDLTVANAINQHSPIPENAVN